MNKKLIYITLVLALPNLTLPKVASAALYDITNGNNNSAEFPYVISESYNGENSQIISSTGTVEQKTYVKIESGVNFINTTFSDPSSSQTQNLHGAVLYSFNSIINFAGNNIFSGNKFNSKRNTYGIIYAAAPYRIGEHSQPEANYRNEITFGSNTLFEDNSAVMGSVIVADAAESGQNIISFGDNTQFINNKTTKNQVGNGGNAGVILSTTYGTSSQTSANTFNFGNEILFKGNRGVRGGVILTDLWAQDNAHVSNIFNFNGNVNFEDNQATDFTATNKNTAIDSIKPEGWEDLINPDLSDSITKATGYGGVIYSEIYSNDNAKADNVFNFFGNSIFTNNTSQGIGGAIVYLSYKENENLVNDSINFSPRQSGQFVLFENNYGSNILNSFYINNAKINFDLQKGTYANIRDPIYAIGKSELNKDGEAGLYLWGDNSDFNGTMNINAGSLYAMFEENQTDEQKAADPQGQRTSFELGGQINFAENTLFRPMMNEARNALAPLDINKVNGASNAILAPYEISKLMPQDYTFNNNFNGFKGFDTPMANLTVNGNTNVLLTIKRNLAGYQGLNDSVEAYRKSDLNFVDRELLDNIYITGEVSDEVKDMFEVTGGNDYINYNNVHRATVRQFSRQIYSRTHNQNIINATMSDKNNHLWFDTSFNQIRKDSDQDNTGYKYDPKGFAVGYDFELIPNALTNGIAAAYTYGKAQTLSNSSITDYNDIDSYLLAYYGKYKPSAFYASWTVGGGYFKNKTQISADTLNANASFHSKAFFANGETGFNLPFAQFNLEPYIGLEYTHIKDPSYNEKGNGGRRFDSTSWDIIEVPVGFRINRRFDFTNFVATPAADIAYAHNFGDSNIKTTAAFIANPGERWQVSSNSDKRSSFRGTASLKFNLKEKPLAFHVGYAMDYRSDYTDQQLFLTMRYDF